MHCRRSEWRNFKLALNQVVRTIEPDVGLNDMMAHWKTISKSLKEPTRRRTYQMKQYFKLSKTS
ncbi:MAG: hypothetical protein OXC67_04865 [Flavobacteriaceae bacterium]|nr:hypothetical protein [Flavobacteriaceae bacterium]